MTTKENPAGTLAFLKRNKLITNEDPHHVHKTLGILVLASYIWRFTRPWYAHMGFLSHPHLTVPTLLLHLSLNLSSFIFPIPQQRIKNGGRIWPEYRLHALIFLIRSCIAMLIRHYWNFYYNQRSSSNNDDKDMTKFYLAGYCLVICAMAAADYATYTKGEKASNSIRNIREIPLMMKYYFSTMQFIGTAFIMTSNTWAVIWYYAFVVQFNPFGMTLVRKNVISHRTNMFLYAFELILGFPVSYRHGYKDLRYVVPQILGIAAAMWRMGPWPKFVPRNKYLIWTVMFALFHWSGLRRAMEENNPKEAGRWCQLADVEVFICIAYYLYKQFAEESKSDSIDNRNDRDATKVEKKD